MLKEKIRQVLDETDTKAGRFFAWFIQLMIFVSLLSFSIETVPELSHRQKHYLYLIEVITVTIFSIEYLLRIYVAKNKLKFIFSFFGLIDLIAILPFYLTTGLDLRAVRVLRMLRIFRILKLVRYNKALKRISKAIALVKEELILFSFIAAMFIYISAIGIYYFEHDAQPEHFKSVFDGLWWAVATLTTVGYGDVYPITTGGKIFTFFILMTGLGAVAVPTGLIASALSEARKEENEAEEKNQENKDN